MVSPETITNTALQTMLMQFCQNVQKYMSLELKLLCKPNLLYLTFHIQFIVLKLIGCFFGE